jgi:DNA-binding beta-propeller fold protein YncE
MVHLRKEQKLCSEAKMQAVRSGIITLLFLSSLAFGAKLRQVAMIDLPGEPGFDAVAMANGNLVIAHRDANTVDIFSPQRRRLVAQVKHVKDPRGIAVDDAAGKVYVAAADSNSIVVFNTSDWQVQGQIFLKNTPADLLIVPETKTLYVSNPNNHSISVVAADSIGARDAELASFDVGGLPGGMAWDPARKLLYVSVEDKGEVLTLNPAEQTKPIVNRMSLIASQPTALQFDPASRHLYAAVRYGVLMLDVDGGSELSRVGAPAGVDVLWLDAKDNALYAGATDGTVEVLNVGASQLRVENELRTDVRGPGLAYDAAKKMLFLPGGREGKSKLVILKEFGAAAQPDAPTVAEKR